MPIESLSAERRLSRDFKVRLGVREKYVGSGSERKRVKVERRDASGGFPVEVDWFVLDEAPKEVQDLYCPQGKQTKSLRIMLPFEWNAQVPATSEDLVYSLYNRAYGAAKGLKCRGTGRSVSAPGIARTSDKEWARRIEIATGVAPEPMKMANGDTYYNVRCLGHDCPKFMLKVRIPDPEDPSKEIDAPAEGHDKDASCNDVAIFRCFLLHPTLDAKSDDYCRVLGTMELATGSINSIIDLQSGFDTVRAFTGGRSEGIPMTLIRKPTTTFRPMRQVHYTCAIHFDHREVQRWAAIPKNEVFLSEPLRENLKRLQAEPLGMTVDSVRDLIPRRLAEAVLVQSSREEAPPVDAAPPEAPAATAVAEAPAEAAGTAPEGPPEDWHDAPRLVAQQLDELKTLAGGTEDPTQPYEKFRNPWRKAAVERLKGAVVAMKSELAIDEPISLSDLRVPHYHWLKARLATLPPLEQDNG